MYECTVPAGEKGRWRREMIILSTWYCSTGVHVLILGGTSCTSSRRRRKMGGTELAATG